MTLLLLLLLPLTAVALALGLAALAALVAVAAAAAAAERRRGRRALGFGAGGQAAVPGASRGETRSGSGEKNALSSWSEDTGLTSSNERLDLSRGIFSDERRYSSDFCLFFFSFSASSPCRRFGEWYGGETQKPLFVVYFGFAPLHFQERLPSGYEAHVLLLTKTSSGLVARVNDIDIDAI